MPLLEILSFTTVVVSIKSDMCGEKDFYKIYYLQVKVDHVTLFSNSVCSSVRPSVTAWCWI